MLDKTVTPRRQRLAQSVIDALRQQIETGALAAGAQLPTEPQLEIQFNVSRTVVREAIAELRAARLVTPIQGKGIFVADPSANAVVALTADELLSIPQTLDMLEFRIAVETEGAGIAAYRRSAKQEEAIRSTNQDMARKIENGLPTIEADVAFHMAVAEATNNPCFPDALRRYGQRSIPRNQFPTLPSANDPQYLLGVLAEHDRILEAIAEQDPEAAKAAMRDHLIGSQKRYRRLAR